MTSGADVPPFARTFFGAAETFTRIGTGDLGGKASGLWFARRVLADQALPGGIGVAVPTLVVVATDVFDRFIAHNRLGEVVTRDLADARIALAFQQAEFPPEYVGDLRALVDEVRTPLAVRSSSRLEDALYRPFAGVYGTKMIPNNQPDADTRFRRLVEAIKFVYATTFFRGALQYLVSTGESRADEKMAVVIQEVVGRRHDERFYPDVSGVARSWNFYPAGRLRPEDGVVELALGLGKTIVDGGLAWTYSPARPRVAPPAASARALLKLTQTRFWAVNMGRPPAHDPVAETEYLVDCGLREAEYDGTLAWTASTYDAQSDRLVPGIGRDGPRALTFTPLLDLEVVPLNRAVKALVASFEQALGQPVEIEFAVTLDPGGEARLGFLQVRPMAVSADQVDVSDALVGDPRVIVASDRTMGNGRLTTLRDIVFVRPDRFETRHTPAVAAELDALNRRLAGEERCYLLIGFGRWGSSDPWLGIPVEWPHISGARAIVEAQLEGFRVEPSQGSHFFHNLTSFGVSYFTVTAERAASIDWSWLMACAVASEGPFVRHVALDAPLEVLVDGRSGRGVILRP